MAWKLYAIEQMRSMARPKLEFHTGAHAGLGALLRGARRLLGPLRLLYWFFIIALGDFSG